MLCDGLGSSDEYNDRSNRSLTSLVERQHQLFDYYGRDVKVVCADEE